MTITVIPVNSVTDLVRRLEERALSPGRYYIFRGHNNAAWSIASTFSRWSTTRLPELRPLAFEQLLYRFENGLAQIGNREMAGMDRRGRLEFARHHGVPSPLIDFTYSPLVALWFAFNGIRGSVDVDKSVSVYALNWNMLGVAYNHLYDKRGQIDEFRTRYGDLPMDSFRWERPGYFDGGYPHPVIKLIPHAASWNTKVQRQMGCFIYDTMNYDALGARDLESFISENPIIADFGQNNNIVDKFIVPCSLAREAFDYLDAMGMNGARLMDDYTGVASDVRNTFNYNPRIAPWDTRREQP